MSAPKILSTGRCLPARVVTNEDLSRRVETNDEWVYSRTGIHARHFCEEETGLDIKNVKLCGVKEWFEEDGTRAMVFFYRTGDYSGTLRSSREGEVFWAPLDKLDEYPLASDFERNLELFVSEKISELFYDPAEDHVLRSY